MNKNQKIIAWSSIIGASLVAGFTTATNYFPDWTVILTAVSGLIGAVVAFITTRNSQ